MRLTRSQDGAKSNKLPKPEIPDHDSIIPPSAGKLLVASKPPFNRLYTPETALLLREGAGGKQTLCGHEVV